MSHALSILPRSIFKALADTYFERHRFPLVCCNGQGEIIYGRAHPSPCPCQRRQPAVFQKAIREALRWGEPVIDQCCMEGTLSWGMPLMLNDELQGGLLATNIPLEARNEEAAARSQRIFQASLDLRTMVVARNLTNTALLDSRRQTAEREREKAEAIHSFKTTPTANFHQLYFRDEPALLAAIKRGERSQARQIINSVLINIYSHGSQRPQLLKSLLLELVVIMSRAAVEAGAHPELVLGMNYQRLTSLSEITDEEQLTAWLTTALEQIMDAIRDHTRYPNRALLSEVTSFMQSHLHENLKRDDVARAVGLSASSLSNLLKTSLAQSFTDLLRQYRIQKARELLLRTEKSLVQIALECGFCDQAYFSNVFRKTSGLSPREYRLQRRR